MAISNARNGYINGSTSGWVARSLFPFGNNLYAVVLNTSASLIEVHKSTDGGVTWTEQDSGDSLSHSNATHSYDANVPYTSNGYIYVAYRTATNTVRVRRFDTATDSWESADIGAANASTTVHADFGIGVAIRSDGDVILGYRSSANNDLYYTVYEGSSWAAQTVVHSSNTSVLLSLTMTDNSDMAHFLFYEITASDLTQRSLDSSNTLGTVGDLDASATTTLQYSSFMGYTNTWGSHLFAALIPDTGGEFDMGRSTSSSAPTWSVTSNVSATSTTDGGPMGGVVVYTQDRIHAIWSGDARGSIHYDRSDDIGSPAFGTDRDIITGLANNPALYAVEMFSGIPVLYTDHTTPSVDLVWAIGSAPSPTIELSPGVASANTSAATTLAVAKPASLADDDVAYITVHLSTGTISAAPSGFTELASDLTQLGCRLYLYRKVITNAAGEPATWDFTTSSTTSSAIAWWARGADLTTPEDTAVSIAANATDSGGTTITGVTTTMADTVLITATCFNSTGSTMYGPTQSADVKRIIETSYRRQIVTFESRPSAGATGNRSAVNSTAGAPSANFAFAIRPASSSVDATGTASVGTATASGLSANATAGAGATGTATIGNATASGLSATGTAGTGATGTATVGTATASGLGASASDSDTPVDATGTQVEATTYTNHMPNPSAETDADGWFDLTTFLGGEATIERSSEQAHSGAYSLKVTCVTPIDLSFFGLPFGNGVVIAFGPDLILSPNPSGDDGVVSVFGRSGTGGTGIISSTGNGFGDPTSLTSSWGHSFHYESAMPGGGVTPTYAIECEAGETFYLDSGYATFNEPLPPGNYGDGDSPGWAWSGTPHASTSSATIVEPGAIASGLSASASAGTGATGTATIGTATASGLAATGTAGQSATGTASVGTAAASGLSATASAGASGTATIGQAAATGLGATATTGTGATGTAAVGSGVASGVSATASAGATGQATVGQADATGAAASATAGTGATGVASVGTATADGLPATANGATGPPLPYGNIRERVHLQPSISMRVELRHAVSARVHLQPTISADVDLTHSITSQVHLQPSISATVDLAQ